MSGVVLGGLAIAGAAASIYSANKQAKAQDRAMRQAERQAQAEAERAEQEMRRQNSNRADISGILAQNQNAALSGGSTLLTGAGGINRDQLNLGGGNTLG